MILLHPLGLIKVRTKSNEVCFGKPATEQKLRHLLLRCKLLHPVLRITASPGPHPPGTGPSLRTYIYREEETVRPSSFCLFVVLFWIDFSRQGLHSFDCPAELAL